MMKLILKIKSQKNPGKNLTRILKRDLTRAFS
jgi:hypothetical protein